MPEAPAQDTPTTPKPGSGTLAEGEGRISGLLAGAQPNPSQVQDEPPTDDELLSGEPGDDDLPEVDDDVVDDEGAREPPDDEPRDRKYTVKVDGEEVEVTLDEALRGHMRQADYTRKTQQVAEFRKKAEAAEAEARQRAQEYAAKLKRVDEQLTSLEPQEPDWDKVKEERPDEYPTLYAEWQRAKDRRQKLRDERAKVEQTIVRQQYEEYGKFVEGEAQKLVEALPVLKDPEKGAKYQSRLREYGVRRGYTPEEMDSVVDSRAVVILDKAMKYDAIMARKQKATAGANRRTAPTAEPGARREGRRPDAQQRQADEARARLSESHSLTDGATAIQGILGRTK